MRRYQVVSLCTVFLASCSATPEPDRFPHSTIRKSIAPGDGAATELILTETPMKDGKAAGPRVRISVYKSSDSLSKQRFRLDGKDKRLGAAALTSNEGAGELLPSAEVTFDEVREGEPVTG